MGRVFSGNPELYASSAFDMKAILNLTPELNWISYSFYYIHLLLSSHTYIMRKSVKAKVVNKPTGSIVELNTLQTAI